MTRILGTYQRLLNKHPFYFQVFQTGVLMGTGDVVAQTVVERRGWKEFSFYRTMSFATVGTFLVGPVLTKWYAFLQRNFGNAKYGNIKKVVVDQTFMAPPLIASIVTSLGIMQIRPISQIKDQLQRDYVDILKTNYKLWPLVQLVNFTVVPVNYQLLVVQIVAIMWNTYLSWKIDDKRIVQK